MKNRKLIYDNCCRTLYWHITEVEERLRAKAEADKSEIVEKLEDLRNVIQREAIASDARAEKTIMAVKDAKREAKYSRRVLRSVEELDKGSERFAKGPRLGKELTEENYRLEEARILQNLRQDEANLQSIRNLSQGIKSRRKARPEVPRPLRTSTMVVDVEEDSDKAKIKVVELD